VTGQLLAEDEPEQLVAVIGDVIEPFAVRAGVLVPHLLHPRPGLSVDPETQGGAPVIAGTRVPYNAVAAKDALDFARYVDSHDPASRVA
jgi:hypothetical protein